MCVCGAKVDHAAEDCASIFAGIATMIVMMFVPGLIAKKYHDVQVNKMKNVRTVNLPATRLLTRRL